MPGRWVPDTGLDRESRKVSRHKLEFRKPTVRAPSELLWRGALQTGVHFTVCSDSLWTTVLGA